MGLSTERKVFLGLFLVAGGALVVDQAFLGPKSAGAGLIESATDLTKEALAEPVEQAKQQAKTSAAELLNERLSVMTASFASDQPVGSMFGMPTREQLPVAITQDQQGTIADAIPATQSGDLPVLSAAMPAKNGGGAVIDGVLIRVGGTTEDGFRLITVRQRSVVLQKDGKDYVVALPAFGE